MPLLEDGDPIGLLVCGQVLLNGRDEQFCENALREGRILGLDPAEVAKALELVPIDREPQAVRPPPDPGHQRRQTQAEEGIKGERVPAEDHRHRGEKGEPKQVKKRRRQQPRHGQRGDGAIDP